VSAASIRRQSGAGWFGHAELAPAFAEFVSGMFPGPVVADVGESVPPGDGSPLGSGSM